MAPIATLGLDIAKTVFQVHELTPLGKLLNLRPQGR
jgi:hypothetical protein